MNHTEQLILRLEQKKACIGVVGLGYVGLPLALSFVESGFKVIGFDINDKIVDLINSGCSHISHIDSNLIQSSIRKKVLYATSDFADVANVDALILCVPTPLNKYREPDLSFILSSIESAIPYLKKGQILSIESTTYPGTTDEVVYPILSKNGFTVGDDFFLVYSPEREDPGNQEYTNSMIPKVIGGITEDCLKIGLSLYKNYTNELFSVSSTRVAEMSKLLENIHRAVNIGLMNEMKIVSDRMGIDLYEVIHAASTKPFGFVPYYPGPGLGGHCIPIDPFYLTWKAREYGVSTHFIELAGEINSSMPQYVVDKVSDTLNLFGMSVKDTSILILGLAYKKNIDDARESPSIDIFRKLASKGAKVSYSDPYLPSYLLDQNIINSENLTEDYLKKVDAIILATDHSSFPYDLIQETCRIIIDTRGKFKNAENVFRA